MICSGVSNGRTLAQYLDGRQLLPLGLLQACP